MIRSYLTPSRVASLAMLVLGSTACSDDDTVAPRRVLTTVNVALGSVALEVGEMTAATAAALDQDGDPIQTGPVTWASDQSTVVGISPTTGLMLAIGPGTTRISATVDGKFGDRNVTVSKAPAIRINEVQSRGDQPNGWVEFVNPTANAVDMTGWTFIDSNFFGPTFTFLAGSVIAPGGLLVIEETALPFGVDAADHIHLFSRFGVLVDGAFWLAQPQTTLGLCPDGTGPFVVTAAVTKGTPNVCPAA